MLKRLALLGTCGCALVAGGPAQAVTINPGTEGLTFTAFDPTTQGTQLAFTSVPGTALTFSAIMRSAVYRNSSGTLDFYYQIARTGAGTVGNQQIDGFTAAIFQGFTVTGFSSANDLDGGGAFTAANNPGGSTTTTGRSLDGQVLQTAFAPNGLFDSETSATYIFRTNATLFTTGTFGIIDGSTFSGLAFAPAVPEPGTWSMMILGFGMIGGALRYRRRRTALTFA